MIKYYPYKGDQPNKKYYIITNDSKKIYLDQAFASDFTIHKDEARKQRYMDRHKRTKIGMMKIQLRLGLAGCCGIYQQLVQVIKILKTN